MTKPLQIGLKYCGGCNPQYDRTALMDRFVQILGTRVTFVRPDAPDQDGLLVIAGCPTACVEFQPVPGLPVWVVTDEDSGEMALRELQQLAAI